MVVPHIFKVPAHPKNVIFAIQNAFLKQSKIAFAVEDKCGRTF